MTVIVTRQHVTGLAELKRNFDAMPGDLRRLALGRGALAGALATRPFVRTLTPIGPRGRKRKGRLVEPGLLRASLITVADRRKSNDTQSVVILRFREKKAAYYAKWVERGHRIVARFKGKYTDYPLRGRGRLTGLAKRRRSPVGFVQGRWMLARGFAAAKGPALAAMLNELQRQAAAAQFLTVRRV